MGPFAFHALLEKGPDARVLREMIGFATEPLMDLEPELPAELLMQRNGWSRS